MFLEKIKQENLVKFAETEFGKVTSLAKLQGKKYGNIFYNMAFRLKENGAYEEAYFYDFEIFPVRFEDLDDRKIRSINKRYGEFMMNNLPAEYKEEYKAKFIEKFELSNENI